MPRSICVLYLPLPLQCIHRQGVRLMRKIKEITPPISCPFRRNVHFKGNRAVGEQWTTSVATSKSISQRLGI